MIFAMSAKGQVYQSMPQYGYQAPRMMFDSTLQIPTTCGVPTLKSLVGVNKKSAIAFDSCNNRFYTYNPKTLTWSQVTGGGGASGIDSLKRVSDSIFARKDGTFYFQYKDSIGSGGGGSGSDTAKVVIAQVRNLEATTLQIGEVVYLKGSTGNTASVRRATNRDDSTSSRTLGVVRASIAPNGTGFVTTQGQVEKMNLGSYAEGDILWLDSIAGGVTKIKPIAPFHGVFIGIVERANNGNGIAYIKPQNGYELAEIHDVRITSPINGQILVYSDTQKIWKNRTITAPTAPTLQDVTTQGATTTDKITMSQYGIYNNEFNALNGNRYSVFNCFAETLGDIQLNWTDDINTSFFTPSLIMQSQGGTPPSRIILKNDEITIQHPDKGSISLLMQSSTNAPFIYLPSGGFNPDTIATRADVRNKGYKIYSATISASGGSSPTLQQQFINEIGVVTFSVTASEYVIQCTGCFPANKTYIAKPNFKAGLFTQSANAYRFDNDNIYIEVFNSTGTQILNTFDNMMIEVKVYD